MTYPPGLQPVTAELIMLPSGRQVDVPKSQPEFAIWTQAPIQNTYGGKAVLNFKGQPVFAELAILHLLKDAGWQAAWIDTYGRVYREGFCDALTTIALPPERERFISDLRKAAGRGGAWDIFGWRGDEVLFAEAKRRSRDRVREGQRRWLEAALSRGLSTESFLIVEWTLIQ